MYDSLPENNRKSTVSVDNGEEPRFLQIAARIRSLITAGDLEAHTALRSERVLAEEQGVSRMTARHALEARETEGLIYSADRRGRFLSSKRLTYDVSNMISFAADARSCEKELEIEVIHASGARADAMVARHLGIWPGAAVFDYLRLFRTNGYTIFIESEYVDA
tara:strand:- start:741 stop:1232 length:492 start_codon:yes stop_codon:yes gene_type:complete